MRKVIIFLLLVAVLLYGCETIVCNAPYIQVGTDCCLDQDNNGICDNDEDYQGESQVVITEKEPQVVEKTVTVKEYVCSDGSIVDDSTKCPIKASEPEVMEPEIPELNTNNEAGTWIDTVTVEPACPNGVNGGKIFFKVGTIPSEIKIQVKELGGEYKDVFSRSGLYEQFQYFGICESCRGAQLNFKLKPDNIYILRLMFNQTLAPKKGTSGIEYSNEHLIDTRADSPYMLKLCNG